MVPLHTPLGSACQTWLDCPASRPGAASVGQKRSCVAHPANRKSELHCGGIICPGSALAPGGHLIVSLAVQLAFGHRAQSQDVCACHKAQQVTDGARLDLRNSCQMCRGVCPTVRPAVGRRACACHAGRRTGQGPPGEEGVLPQSSPLHISGMPLMHRRQAELPGIQAYESIGLHHSRPAAQTREEGQCA